MAGNSLGRIFRVTTAGESHGAAQVVIIDGVPAGLELGVDDLLPDLARRRPGQSALTSARNEPDRPEILAGLYQGRTTGSPLAVVVHNTDTRPVDYAPLADVLRPGHADMAWLAKYGLRDPRGGGRSSARETVTRVIAGAVARKLLATAGIRVLGWVVQVEDVVANPADPDGVTLAQVEASPVRCPDPAAAARMIELIEACRDAGDSLGGVAEIRAWNVPPGLGEPVFDKLRADLGKALLSLPAVMGVEFGAGFAAARSRGSRHNDPFTGTSPAGVPVTEGNNHGGLLGGLSSGMPIIVRCAVKPTSSISVTQHTLDTAGRPVELSVTGRHDPCLLPRFIPMAEAMVLVTLADHWLLQRAARL
jgi:chorismate synthase